MKEHSEHGNDKLQGMLLEWKEASIREERQLGEELLNDHVLLWCSKGKSEWLVDDVPVKLSRFDLCLLPPGTRIQPLSGNYGGCRRLDFELFRAVEWTEDRRVYKKERSFPAQACYQNLPKHLSLQFEALWAQSLNDGTGKAVRRQHHKLIELVELLLSESRTPIKPANPDRWLDETLAYMQSHYTEELKLDKLASVAGMHPSYYSQLFKQRMGKTPVELLTQLRMNKAKELLLDSDYTVREVGRLVGYRDEFYFSRRFKELNGCPPTEFGKRSLRNIVSLSAPYTDHLLTLGITPCAAQAAKEILQGVKPLTLPMHAYQPWEIGREAFLSVQPDVILCKENVVSPAREHLGDMAPVIAVPWTRLDLFGHLRYIARLLNREEAAEQWLEEHTGRAEQSRRKVKRRIGTASVALCELKGEGFRMYGERNVGHVFYRSLQLPPPERIRTALRKQAAGTGFTWLSGSLDEISAFASDVLLVFIKSAAERRKALKLMQSNPNWRQHPAVRSGRWVILEQEDWIDYAPRAIDRQLQQAVRLFSGKQFDDF